MRRLEKAVSAWEKTLTSDFLSYRKTTRDLRRLFSNGAGPPDIHICRRALDIHDSLEPNDWEQAWAFAFQFQEAQEAVKWIVDGWYDERAAGDAHRKVGNTKKALAVLKKRKLTIRDVQLWESDVGDFPWDADGWTPAAREVMAALHEYWEYFRQRALSQVAVENDEKDPEQ